jgi:hypothetical protein
VETGIDEGDLRLAIRAMKELGADREVIRDAGQQAAQILLNRARPLIPVKTGRLRDAAETGRLDVGGTVRVRRSVVPYANPIHWGWIYDKKRFIYRGIKPQPFFTEALGYTREEIFATYERLMQKNINNLPGVKR